MINEKNEDNQKYGEVKNIEEIIMITYSDSKKKKCTNKRKCYKEKNHDELGMSRRQNKEVNISELKFLKKLWKQTRNEKK